MREFHPFFGEEGSPSVLGADFGAYVWDVAADVE